MSGTLVEQLGFEAGSRVAVVHVDDVGMCHAANEGAFEALANGPVTCGSMMVPCAWFPEAVARARANPRLDLGVHLTLTSEWDAMRWRPLAGGDRVPSLVDDEGYFWRSEFEAAANAKPDEVDTELRAQIDCALAAGIDVTHLDSHMGTVFFPSLVEVYAGLLLDYRLPGFLVRPSHTKLGANGMSEGLQHVESVVEGLAEKGIPVLEDFANETPEFPAGEGLAHNRAILDRLPQGVSYLICHAARLDHELAMLTPHAHCRDWERGFYGGEAGRAELESRSIHTVGMRALRELVRGGS